MIKTRKQMFVVIGAFILVLLLGTASYAFFNYTRSGETNTVKTGRISFNTSYTAINLTNAFPISSQQASDAENPNVKTLEIAVTGDTDYDDGIEYLVTARDVHMTSGTKQMPLTVEVGVVSNTEHTPATTLGTIESGDYYTARSGYRLAGTNKYKVVYDGSLNEGDRLLVGYIAPNAIKGTASGIDGIITIKTYFDASKILITDTYEEVEVSGYVNGTPANEMTVLTTEEWNNILGTPFSFKIRIEANLGIWVSHPGSAPMELEEVENTPMVPTDNRIVVLTTQGDGTLSCQSSDESVATCEIEEIMEPEVSPSNNEDINPEINKDLAVGDIKPTKMVNETPVTRHANLKINAVGVGTATITVNKSVGADYEYSSVLTYDVVVAKQSTTMSLSSDHGTIVKGESGNVTITTNGDGALSCNSDSANASCSISGSVLTITGVNVGTANITVSQGAGTTHLAASDVTYAVTIDKITPTFAVGNNNVNITYGGSNGENAYSYNGDGTVSCASGDTTKVTCSVDTENHKIVVTPIVATTSAVTMTISVPETGSYYAPSNVTFTVNVGPKLLVANTPSCNNKTYDGSDSATCTVSYNNVESGDSVLGTATCTFSDANVGTGKIVTCGSFTKSGTGNENYAVPTTNSVATANITAKQLVASTPSCDNKTYDGNNTANCTISYTNVESVDSVSGTATCTFSDANVGTSKTVTCNSFTKSGTGNGNYTVPGGNKATTANITSKQLTASITNCGKTYDGSDSATCTISYNNVESGDSVLGTATCTFSDANVGTSKTVTCNSFTKSGTGNSNYTVPTNGKTTTANISAAASTCPTTSNYSGTYDESSHTINVTAAASGGTAYYRVDGGSWGTTNPAKTNAGTYTVDVKVVGDSNHTDNTSCTSRTISIARKNTTMSISPTSGTIRAGTSTTTTITTDGDGTKSCTTSNGSVASCSVSGNTVTINGIAGGSATITVKQAQGNNYNAATDRTYSITVSDYDGKKCVRVTDATKLHTEECTNSRESYYCKGDGYVVGNLGTMITYGNAKALNTQLAVGDAFDCDVNGDGIINKDGNGNSTERFYYVSEYYNTDTKSFDTSTGYATLIYYRNFYYGSPSDSGGAYATQEDIQEIDSNATDYDNWHGPVTAVKHLPTTTLWSNITLKTTSRTILACDDSDCSNTPVLTTDSGSKTITNPFSYAGRAARLLTVQEIKHAGCDELSSQTSLTSTGALKACNFLLEGTKYSSSSKATYGLWLETPRTSTSYSVLYAYAEYRSVFSYNSNFRNRGVRPTIDMPYSQMWY